tara:strand:+ start:1384 stop:1584 length:201 start_codon:yes stop_codon:yes gene_type:complete
MSTEIAILGRLVEGQQAIIDSLTAEVERKNSELEGCKKTISQMKADRVDELESLTAKNFERFNYKK